MSCSVPRVWHVPRPVPDPAALARGVEVLRSARKPLIVAGGGVIYSEATEALRRFAEATGIPVRTLRRAKAALPWDHPRAVGGVGATGSPVANALAREADVVLGIGTRYSDFTSASRTAFQHPDVRFVNLNVAAFDAAKHSAVSLVADARAGLEALAAPMGGYRVDDAYTARAQQLISDWRQVVDRAYHLGHQPLPAQTEILGALNELMGERDVVVQAAGSMPGDLQMLWRARDPKQYHVEYGYSCMGYEIAGGLGAKLADPGREVFVLVGDGSYLMMAQEIVTAVAEQIKLTIVLVENHGFASIGALSESLGSQRFGTSYRYREPANRSARWRHPPGRPRGERCQPRCRRAADPDRGRSSAPAWNARRRRTGRPSCTWKPTRSHPSLRPRAGGTFPCPRSPHSTAPRRHARHTRLRNAASDVYL